MNSKLEARIVGLLRHGEAVVSAATDAERKLTKRGWTQASQVAGKFVQWIDLHRIPHGSLSIYHSPYVRARETAQPLIESLPGVVNEVLDYILPDNPPSLVLARLRTLAASNPDKHLIIVSHMPLLASLCALLETGNLHDAKALNTGELRLLQTPGLEEGGATCIKILTPN
jgi:phosphohistidine phosphatase SixA